MATRSHRILFTVCLALAASCRSASSNASSNVPAAPLPAKTPGEETRVFLRPGCLLSESGPTAFGQESILGTIVPVLIDKTLGFAVSALKKAGDKEVVKKIAELPTYLYTRQTTNPPSLALNPDFGCIILVQGQFTANSNAFAPAKPLSFKTSEALTAKGPDADKARLERLQENGIPVSQVKMLAEVRVIPAVDGTAVRYEPRFLWTTEFLGERSKDSRTLVVNLAIAGATAKPDDSSLSSAIVDFGEIHRNSIYGRDHSFPPPRSTPWAGGIGVSKESAEAFKAKFDNPRIDRYMPVTFVVGFAETADGNALAKFLADLLDSNKKEIASFANERLNPDEKAKAAEQVVIDQGKLLDAATAAYQNYLAARAAFQSAIDATSATPPVPLNAERRAQLDFERKRTQRLFCNAYAALKKSGAKPVDFAQADLDACDAL